MEQNGIEEQRITKQLQELDKRKDYLERIIRNREEQFRHREKKYRKLEKDYRKRERELNSQDEQLKQLLAAREAESRKRQADIIAGIGKNKAREAELRVQHDNMEK